MKTVHITITNITSLASSCPVNTTIAGVLAIFEVYQVGGGVVLTAAREKPSEGDDMQRGGEEGWQLFSWAQQLMHEESWETVEGIGSKSSISMPAGRRRDKKKVACGVMLCSHEGSK